MPLGPMRSGARITGYHGARAAQSVRYSPPSTGIWAPLT